MLRTRQAAVAALALSLAALPLSTAGATDRGDRGGGSTSAGPAASSAPGITPTPQSVHARHGGVTITRTVDLVTGPKADPAAVALVRRALEQAGAHRVELRSAARPGRLAVYVDGPSAAKALRGLGARGTAGLPAEGYALVIGKGRIALAGADATGTYYAAQSLRQLLPHTRHPYAHVRGVTVRDWPATPLRGVIEGFYGTPWSHEARLEQLDFDAAHKMNIYAYSPKDDPYLRAKWRDPYPAPQLGQLKELVDRARADHVEFTYALSPGLSVCYSSDADAKALTAKFETLWNIGVRTFAVPLDDISYTKWNCDADEKKFGTGGGAAGAAQAQLLNRVNHDFIAAHKGAQPLQMVPTEYYDIKPSPYKKAIADQLDQNVLVEWTGVGVIAPTMTRAQAKTARSLFGHQILTWDNYPVNDYVSDHLLLGPFNGREKGLAGDLAGITANPMVQPAASKIGLYTVADFAWNDQAYDARTSWNGALRELAGDDARTERALRAFADANYGSRLNPQQSPELAAAFGKFWKSGDVRRLDATLRALRAAPDVLRARLADRGFIDDAGPWLDSTKAWGTAARTALAMVDAVRDGDRATAQRLRQRLSGQVKTAKSFVYVDLNGKRIPVVVGDKVLDAFVDKAVAEYDAGRFKGAGAR
ncbi:beta-N-acetylglucosaminidase domain-containing protein [Streptomyces sp. NPDC050610]|uniref:beta-N-acetylglucosaminidase domain-containing protein n=1 Tax=Streptomyces sp. NPDC050610 TaxID=3157097 RepID=UPI003415FA8E